MLRQSPRQLASELTPFDQYGFLSVNFFYKTCMRYSGDDCLPDDAVARAHPALTLLTLTRPWRCFLSFGSSTLASILRYPECSIPTSPVCRQPLIRNSAYA